MSAVVEWVVLVLAFVAGLGWGMKLERWDRDQRRTTVDVPPGFAAVIRNDRPNDFKGES